MATLPTNWCFGGVTPDRVSGGGFSEVKDTEVILLDRKGKKLFRDTNGVCAAVVLDWLKKDLRGTSPLASPGLNRFALSLMQSAFQRGVFLPDDDDVEVAYADYFLSHQLDVRRAFDYSGNEATVKACNRLNRHSNTHAFVAFWNALRQGHCFGFKYNDQEAVIADPNNCIFRFQPPSSFYMWLLGFLQQEYPGITKIHICFVR